MKHFKFIPFILLMTTSLAFVGCGDDDDTPDLTTFTVTIENVSTENLIATDRAMGTVPLSPPVFAVYEDGNPIFEVGEDASEGVERVAEDGAFDALITELSDDDDIFSFDAVTSPGGPDNGGALFTGESVSYTFSVSDPDATLQFITMMVQSNDWFYAFAEDGVPLFDTNGDPISGNLIAEVLLYDAGTEADTPPGTGPDQKPVQSANDQGPSENEDVQIASVRHPTYPIPLKEDVISVMITNGG